MVLYYARQPIALATWYRSARARRGVGPRWSGASRARRRPRAVPNGRTSRLTSGERRASGRGRAAAGASAACAAHTCAPPHSRANTPITAKTRRRQTGRELRRPSPADCREFAQRAGREQQHRHADQHRQAAPQLPTRMPSRSLTWRSTTLCRREPAARCASAGDGAGRR